MFRTVQNPPLGDARDHRDRPQKPASTVSRVPPVSACARTQVFGELLLGTLARRPQINSIWPRSLVCVSKWTIPHKGGNKREASGPSHRHLIPSFARSSLRAVFPSFLFLSRSRRARSPSIGKQLASPPFSPHLSLPTLHPTCLA